MPHQATPTADILSSWNKTNRTLDLALALVTQCPTLSNWSSRARLTRLLTAGSEQGT
jgi:hypothetical protein